MSKKIQLSIPKPCHEDWNAMTPVEKGKFCGSCQKQVVDFSSMSDRQVAEFFKKPSTGSVCGRFMADQLERDIEIPRKRIPWIKYFFSIALPAFFLSRAAAQNGQKMGKIKPATRDTMPTNINREYKTMGMVALPDKFIPVEKGKQKGEEGRVVDAISNIPLPGAQVYLLSTIGKERIYVQRDGSFIIDIYRKITVDRIEISMPGYISKKLSLAEFMKAANAKEPIQMEREDIVGKIAVVDCVKPEMRDTIAYTLKGEIQTVVNNKMREISGIVQDETGAPVTGASVIIKGTRIGVATRNDGGFKISVIGGDILVIAGEIAPVEWVVGKDSFITITVKRNIVCGREIIVASAGMVIVKKVDKMKPETRQKKQPSNHQNINHFKVFPNPLTAGSSLTIEWKQTEESYYSLQFLNVSGQLVHQKEIWIDAEARLLHIDLPAVVAGSYFLCITNKKTGKRFTEKVIVE